MADEEFRFTFGTRYDHERHPRLPGVTAGHYVTIVAADDVEARNLMFAHVGVYWAFDYQPPPGGWESQKAKWAKQCPAGEYRRFSRDTPVPPRRPRYVNVALRVIESRRFTEQELADILGMDLWYIQALDNADLKLAAEESDAVLDAVQGYGNHDDAVNEVVAQVGLLPRPVETIELPANEPCTACEGTGINDDSHAGNTCETCGGKGIVNA